jgi:hypothetical protein
MTRGKRKESFKKMSGFCSLAYESGFEWCWLDTCCINKESSAELSEAINSMYRWYAHSQVCFAYLVDVEVDHAIPEQLKQFKQSRWHTRGWTLQELLAPERVEFYDVDWNQIGTRFTLRDAISGVTGIRAEILAAKFDVQSSQRKYCVAEKMSWASKRDTTRLEDMAYCLVGIFNINMPLLYGEGIRAFERLQLQILTETEDLTLFAWKSGLSPYQRIYILAESPSYFCDIPSINGANGWTYQSLGADPYEIVWRTLVETCLEAMPKHKMFNKRYDPKDLSPSSQSSVWAMSSSVLPFLLSTIETSILLSYASCVRHKIYLIANISVCPFTSTDPLHCMARLDRRFKSI